MFCYKTLLGSDFTRELWKTAHNLELDDNDIYCSLNEKCAELDRWIRSDAVQTTQRLSLRTSSTLVAGAAKLYRIQLDRLYKDMLQFQQDLVNKRRCSDSSSESTSSLLLRSPEQMMRNPEDPNLLRVDTRRFLRKRHHTTTSPNTMEMLKKYVTSDNNDTPQQSTEHIYDESDDDDDEKSEISNNVETEIDDDCENDDENVNSNDVIEKRNELTEDSYDNNTYNENSVNLENTSVGSDMIESICKDEQRNGEINKIPDESLENVEVNDDMLQNTHDSVNGNENEYLSVDVGDHNAVQNLNDIFVDSKFRKDGKDNSFSTVYDNIPDIDNSSSGLVTQHSLDNNVSVDKMHSQQLFKNQASQTSPPAQRHRQLPNDFASGDTPYGIMTIFSQRSRIPNYIIYADINIDVVENLI